MEIRISDPGFERELAVCFTGHRPDKLPWGANEQDERCAAFKRRLENEIMRAYDEGARFFLSGMADGVDVIAAEAVLGLARKCPDMKLIAVFPFGFGSSPRKKHIAKQAYSVISLREEYVSSCYMDRNRFLVDHSSRIICGFSGNLATGTGSTIRMAQREGLKMIIINV